MKNRYKTENIEHLDRSRRLLLFTLLFHGILLSKQTREVMAVAKLPRDFFLGDTVEIARNLLGTYLVRQLPGQTLAVRITETEAYVGRCDKACHAYQYRRTDRTKTMFGPPGYAYIYLIYGMYHCLNLVTEPEGEPSAVLIRGAEPILGTKMIRWLRYGEKPLTPVREKNLLNGPGKLCKGISLDRTFDGQDLCSDILYLCDSPADFGVPSIPLQHEQLRAGPRIGIDYAEEARFFPWRFWLEKEE